jgi:hypothetical protein
MASRNHQAQAMGSAFTADRVPSLEGFFAANPDGAPKSKKK